MNIYALLACNH